MHLMVALLPEPLPLPAYSMLDTIGMVTICLDDKLSTWGHDPSRGPLPFFMRVARCLLNGCIFYPFLRENKRM